jgi:hypothetical protein
MKIIAIDPGRFKSAWLVYNNKTKMPEMFGISQNENLLSALTSGFKYCEFLAIEMVEYMGMSVGRTIFETVFWTGRFVQAYRGGEGHKKIARRDVKMHLCNSMRAKDANVRQAIIDRYEPTGGGATPEIGTKSQPGPLYGVSKDVWSALGIAITAAWLVQKA